jgi:hypothetical protein
VIVSQDVAEAEGFGRLGVVAQGSRIIAKFGLGENKANFHNFLLMDLSADGAVCACRLTQIIMLSEE